MFDCLIWCGNRKQMSSPTKHSTQSQPNSQEATAIFIFSPLCKEHLKCVKSRRMIVFPAIFSWHWHIGESTVDIHLRFVAFSFLSIMIWRLKNMIINTQNPETANYFFRNTWILMKIVLMAVPVDTSYKTATWSCVSLLPDSVSCIENAESRKPESSAHWLSKQMCTLISILQEWGGLCHLYNMQTGD